MKRLRYFGIILALTFITTSSSFTKTKKVNLKTIEGQFHYLLLAHQKYLNSQFKKMRHLSNFDRAFYTDINFMNDSTTKSFFQTIKASVEKGNIPRGLMRMSVTKFVSINGKFAGVHYEYRSNGKEVTLIKATNNNGHILKALYQYNTKGRLLKVKEFQNNKMISDKVHTIKI